MALDPTAEQQAAIDAFQTGGSLALEAGAGTGKTTALTMLAQAAGGRRGLYLAYNKAIATDAQQRFPQNTRCMTAHALAYRAVGHRFKDRLNGPRIPASQVARILGITGPLEVGDGKFIPATALARIAQDTALRFCYSADREVKPRHVPTTNGVEDHNLFASVVAPLGRAVWDDAQRPTGRLRYQHDYYLKSFCLSQPTLDFDYLLMDEGQDANPCVAGLFSSQPGQLVIVGDSCQQLYAWRGSDDAIAKFPADHRLPLSVSFRFGQPVADEANKWLELLEASLRLSGKGGPSELGELERPDAILCRTNAEAVAQVLSAQQEEIPVALVGGAADIKRLAEAAQQLQAGQSTTHPELLAFTSWAMVQDYCDSGGGTDLRTFVRLIDSHGPEKVIDACERTVPEGRASLVVSTAHRAKGREWRRVKIADDFQPGEDGGFGRSEMMLAYVAVTRARGVLDRGSLEIVERLLKEHRSSTQAPPETSAQPAASPTPVSAPPPRTADLTVTLPTGLAEQLRQLAERNGRTPERLAEHLIATGLDALDAVPTDVGPVRDLQGRQTAGR